MILKMIHQRKVIIIENLKSTSKVRYFMITNHTSFHGSESFSCKNPPLCETNFSLSLENLLRFISSETFATFCHLLPSIESPITIETISHLPRRISHSWSIMSTHRLLLYYDCQTLSSPFHAFVSFRDIWFIVKWYCFISWITDISVVITQLSIFHMLLNNYDCLCINDALMTLS